MTAEIMRYRREEIDPQINAVAYEAKPAEPTIVVNMDADRKAIGRLKAYREHLLVWIPGLQVLVDSIQRAWSGNPITGLAAAAVLAAGTASGAEMVIMPDKPLPSTVRIHMGKRPALERVASPSSPRPIPVAHVAGRVQWTFRRPSAVVHAASSSPSASPTPTSTPSPEPSPEPSTMQLSIIPPSPPRMHRRPRARISLTPVVERSETRTPSPTGATVVPTPAHAGDTTTP
ncbi:hypothetical protein IMZ11_02830 [Microtetraspora sp. AC03309]|uniref:hypothetical protein n=1 Tax=Microtetraspora sp. AC03309 TaxID=2779376 RepID=UPI001E4089FE|nr:hypothetical protein [Microtetraspora sp. AC03309]MCC5574575.1 hypothetical protein [Microtetraspora sp. AC03309]